MSVRNGFALLLALSALLFLGACGSNNGTTIGTAPPTGGFTASDFNGTYVFSTSGYNVDGFFMVIGGAFTANGSKGITGGNIDIISGDTSVGINSNQAIGSTSSYTVGQDGRGQAQLTNTPLGTITLDFVLSSNSHALVTEYDSNGTGSGTMDLQTTLSQSQLAGSYTFSISGVGSTSFATIGTMTLDPTGLVTTGVQDFNNDGGATTNAPLSTTSTVIIGTGTAPGTASLVTTLGTYTFDVYAVDTTHLKFVESDGQLILSGDAFTAGTTLPISQNLAFTMSGGDQSSLPLALGGVISLDGNSNILAGGEEDFNDGGTVGSNAGVSGGFSALSAGRSQLSVSGFVNSAANQVAGSYTFAAYPFTSNGVTGFELLEIDGLGVTAGTAFVQTGTSLAASQGYGMNLSAINLGTTTGSNEFEEDDIAEFSTSSSSSLTGVVDFNDQGSTTPAQGLSGSYTAGSASGSYAVTTTNAFNVNLYAVNNSTFLVMEVDSDQVGTGVVELQNESGSAGSEPEMMVHRSVGAHPLIRHK